MQRLARATSGCPCCSFICPCMWAGKTFSFLSSDPLIFYLLHQCQNVTPHDMSNMSGLTIESSRTQTYNMTERPLCPQLYQKHLAFCISPSRLSILHETLPIQTCISTKKKTLFIIWQEEAVSWKCLDARVNTRTLWKYQTKLLNWIKNYLKND